MLEHNVPFQIEGLRAEFTILSIILFLKWGFSQRGLGCIAISRYAYSPCRKSLSQFFYSVAIVSLQFSSPAIQSNPHSSTCYKTGNQTQKKYATKVKHLNVSINIWGIKTALCH